MIMIHNTIKVLLFFLMAVNVYGQMGPVAYYNFDDCTVTDQAGTFNSGTINGNPDCDCGVGVNSNAFYFDGSPDSLVLDPSMKTIFDDDFSIGFYLWVEDAVNNYPIMSIQGECASARDSAFFVRYFPDTEEIIVEFTKNFGEGVPLRASLDTGFCWDHILFTKEGSKFSLYVNGEFIMSEILQSVVTLGEDFPFLIGASPCVGVTDQFFEGRIDELQLFNFALIESEDINSVLVDEDRIITRDTTIFEGSSFVINSGSSCANSINWSPSDGLNSTTIFNPEASPTITTTYSAFFDHGTCESNDEISVSVISEDDIECGTILIPNAFTPNNDGLNDDIGISNIFIIEDITRFEIYNRWGLKLWEANNKADRWDGTYLNEPMPSGTYVYKVEYTCLGNTFRNSASINILK